MGSYRVELCHKVLQEGYHVELLVSLMVVPYTYAETCCSMTFQLNKKLWLVASFPTFCICSSERDVPLSNESGRCCTLLMEENELDVRLQCHVQHILAVIGYFCNI